MTWNNVYLTTPSAVGNYQGSAASTVLSALSVSGTIDTGALDVAGTTTLSGALNSASAISGGAITGTTVTASAYTFSIAGKALTFVSASSFSLSALSALANRSVYTTLSVNSVQAGDFVQVCPVSSMSSDLVLQAECRAASTILLRVSNVSGTAANAVAIPVRYWVWRFV